MSAFIYSLVQIGGRLELREVYERDGSVSIADRPATFACELEEGPERIIGELERVLEDLKAGAIVVWSSTGKPVPG